VSPTARAVAGAICVLLFVGLSYLGSRIALGALREDYRVEVIVGELGQGIVSGSDVKMRGVVVGRVGDIGLTDDLRAVAELVLEARYAVPERALFQITGKTLLGEKQIEIVFDGAIEDGPYLAEGTRVDDPGRVVEFEDVLASLARLTAAIDADDLGVVVDDLFGAFDGAGPDIARSIEQGARAAGVFERSLDDQVANTRDLGLVVESLATAADDFNRLGATVIDGLPALSDNQAEIRRLLDDLAGFSRTLNATFTVNRPDIDRMIVQGDNVVRLLFDYRPQVGEVLTGLSTYTTTFDRPGFTSDTHRGGAAPFQILLTSDDIETQLCGTLPAMLIQTIPICEPFVDTGPGGGDGPALPMPHAAEGRLGVELPGALVAPEVPARLDLDAVMRRALAAGDTRSRRGAPEAAVPLGWVR
jgi:virulence factor Mce-like protein